MQLAALLGFHTWLPQVGCPTPAVMVSHGVGVVLVQMSCYPLVFLPCDCAATLSAASPSGFCTLDGWVSMSDSSLLVYSWGGVGGVWLRPLPHGLRRALFFLLQVPLVFSGHRGSVLLLPWWRRLGFSNSLLFLGFSCSACLLGVVGVLHPVSGCSSWGVVCLVCRWGHPAAFSLTLEWVCFWPKVSHVFVGCEGGLGCPSWFIILFLCLLVLHLFWGWGVLVTGWWPLLQLLVLDSLDARLHLPDALASDSAPISGRWMVQAHALAWALPWVLPSRFQCWLLACGGWGLSLVVLPP